LAKLKGPLFSLGASQQLGKALVYFNWKGLNVVREFVIPANPKTTGQTTQRGYMTAAVAGIHAGQAEAVNPLDADDVIAYALWASVVQSATTWFNQATRNWVDQLVAGLSGRVYRNGTTTPAANSLGMHLYATTWGGEAGDFWYGTSKTALINSAAATVNLELKSVTVAGLTTGVKYFWQYRPTAPAAIVGNYSGIYYGVPT